MKHELTKQEDGTISIKITVPWEELRNTREKVIENMVKSVSQPGFRKGTAPKNIAREKLSKEAVNEEVLKTILPDYYIKTVKEEKILPIINPKIHVEPLEEGKDLTFIAETSEEPQVDFENYKDEIKKITAKSKIVVPGKEPEKVSIEKIIEALIKTAEVKISKLLIEQETNRLLTQLLDEIKILGLTLEQYLASKNKSGEDLRKEYEERARKDLALEFILRKIADQEKISVEQKDIDEVLEKVKDENQKEDLRKNSYVISSIIRQQKTLDFLSKI